jgi:hypothetical protein
MPKKFTVPGGWVDTEDPNFKAVSEEAFKKTETFRAGEAAKVANEAQIKSDALAAKNDKDIPLKAPFPAPRPQDYPNQNQNPSTNPYPAGMPTDLTPSQQASWTAAQKAKANPNAANSSQYQADLAAREAAQAKTDAATKAAAQIKADADAKQAAVKSPAFLKG